jgi:glc operon protein GlcG
MVSEAAWCRALPEATAAHAVDGALAQARTMGVPVTIAVVDEGGNLKAMRRMDGAPLVSVQTAHDKAYAAAAIGMPVDEFFDAIKQDAAAVASFASRPGLALIAGGVPLRVAGVVVGGLGVAGAMAAADDRKIAEAGARQASS